MKDPENCFKENKSSKEINLKSIFLGIMHPHVRYGTYLVTVGINVGLIDIG